MVKRILRGTSTLQTIVDQKQLGNLEYFHYVGSTIASYDRSETTRECGIFQLFG